MDHRPALTASSSLFPALMGAFGVAMGFAAFILIREEGQTPAVFLTGLLAAALTSYVIEAVKERAEGEEHRQRPEPGRVLGLLVLLAIFEIFVSGVEKSVALVSAGEAGALLDQVFVNGITTQVGALVQLLLFAGLWVVLGGAAAWSVVAGTDGGALPSWRASLRRVGLGMARVAGIALAYVLATRLAVTIWVLLMHPQDYRPAFSSLLEYQPGGAGQAIAQLPILLATGIEQLAGMGRWGGALVLGAVALLILVAPRVLARSDSGFGMRLVTITLVGALVLLALGPFATSGEQFGRLVRIVGASTLIWLVPLVVLTVARPRLDRSSRSPRVWGIASFVVALLLVVLTWDRLSEPPVPLYVATLVVAMVVTSWLFFRGADVVRFWPLVALTLAIAAFEGSSLLQRLTFLTTFKEAALLQDAPIRGGDEARASRGYAAIDEWAEDSLIDEPTVSLVRAVRALPVAPQPTLLDSTESRLARALDSTYTGAVNAICRSSGSPLLDAIHAGVAESCAQVRRFAPATPAAPAAPGDSAASRRWVPVWDTLWMRVRGAPWGSRLDAALDRGGEVLQFDWYRLRWQDTTDREMREAHAHARRYLPDSLAELDPVRAAERALFDSSLADSVRGWLLLHAFAASPPPGSSVRLWADGLGVISDGTDGRISGLPITTPFSWWYERHRRLADLFEARHRDEVPERAPSPLLRRSSTSFVRRQLHAVRALRFAHAQLYLRRLRVTADQAFAAEPGATVALELALGASFAFWATAGLLAGLASGGTPQRRSTSSAASAASAASAFSGAGAATASGAEGEPSAPPP